MRACTLALATAILLVVPASGFSQTIHLGPGGVHIHPFGHHRDYDHGYSYRHRPHHYYGHEGRSFHRGRPWERAPQGDWRR